MLEYCRFKSDNDIYAPFLCKIAFIPNCQEVFLCNVPKLKSRCNKTDFFCHYFNDRSFKGREMWYNVIINTVTDTERLRGDIIK